MSVIAINQGYIVTNGTTFVKTFIEHEFETREACRNSAIAFSYMIELYYASGTCERVAQPDVCLDKVDTFIV